MEVFLSDSDWESSRASSSSDEYEDIETLFGGQAQSIFSNLEASIGKIDDFLSFERGFVHGDVVCYVTDPSGQTGRVVNVDMLVDLENVHGKVIHVNSKKLSKIRSISVGDYVIHGPWLGRVDRVIDRVTILFDDGRKCDVTATDQNRVVPISSNFLEDPQYPFFPGQRVRVRLSAFSNSSGWLCGSTWKENLHEGTISSVNAGLVYVDWLASALVDDDVSLPSPPRIEDSKNLTLLSCFSHANWQLGDWCLLPSSDCRDHMERMFDYGCPHTNNLKPSSDEIFVIAKKKTKVDILWQDGTHSFGIDSQSLLPIHDLHAHEFWPEQFVLEKWNYDVPHVSSSQRWGVVRGADAKERTVKVKWKPVSLNQGDDIGKDWEEETMSTYELVEHPDYSFCFGDVVFRLIQNNPIDKVYSEHVQYETGKQCGREQNKNLDKLYLSYIGNVIGFKDGVVEVRWANGLMTKVAPCEILRLDKHDSLTENATLYEENVADVNQEMVLPDKETSNQEGKDLLKYKGVCEDSEKHPGESSSTFIIQSAMGFFTSLAANLFGSLGSTSFSSPMTYLPICEDAQVSGSIHDKEALSNNGADLQALVVGELQVPFSSISDCQEKYSQFDVVDDFSDHHFLDSPGKILVQSSVRGSWLKNVQKEWNLLEKNLPETIYVRICEGKMNLLRAVIVGCCGTPYHDGLYFFDIFLPPDYPHQPPLVHYHSGGLRVNPNLYESGRVCLSLLNTWTGTDTEVWNPSTSSVLQVLLSLQALVLNDKPYFNEAGYEKHIGRAEGEKNSVSYNENAFLVNCKLMIYLIRMPPKHFEALVEEHFSLRAHSILLACKAYMEGCPVGHAFECKDAELENREGCSTGFKIMLVKLFPKLVEAFSGKGIDCSQFTAP